MIRPGAEPTMETKPLASRVSTTPAASTSSSAEEAIGGGEVLCARPAALVVEGQPVLVLCTQEQFANEEGIALGQLPDLVEQRRRRRTTDQRAGELIGGVSLQRADLDDVDEFVLPKVAEPGVVTVFRAHRGNDGGNPGPEKTVDQRQTLRVEAVDVVDHDQEPAPAGPFDQGRHGLVHERHVVELFGGEQFVHGAERNGLHGGRGRDEMRGPIGVAGIVQELRSQPRLSDPGRTRQQQRCAGLDALPQRRSELCSSGQPNRHGARP